MMIMNLMMPFHLSLAIVSLATSSLSVASSAFQFQAAPFMTTRHSSTSIQGSVAHQRRRRRSSNTLLTKLRLVPSSSFENNGDGKISNNNDDFSSAATTSSSTTLIAFFPTKGEEHQNNFINSFSSSLIPTLTKEPGFRSCQIYKSTDGRNVVLFERWQSQQECNDSYSEKSLATSIRTSLKFVLEIDDDSVDRHMYNTVATHHGRNDDAIFAAAAAAGIGGTGSAAGGAGSPTLSSLIQIDQFIATNPSNQPQLSQSVWEYIRNDKPDPTDNHSATSSVYQSSDGQRVTVMNHLLLHDDQKDDVDKLNPIEQERILDLEYQYWEREQVKSAHRMYRLVSSHEADPSASSSASSSSSSPPPPTDMIW